MDLEKLRAELAGVDRQLIELVARRQELAMEIGRVKRQAGTPTRNFDQEREVIKRARANAADAKISADIAEELLLLLIRSSLTVQEQDKVVAHGEGKGRRVLVIGGAGKMGRWSAQFLSSQGYDVEIADPAGTVDGYAHINDWQDSDLSHDIIVVAAPLRISNEILHQLAQRKPAGLIFDVGSLKSPLRSGLTALVDAGAKVTSLHPMFGPNTDLLSGRHIIFVDLGNKEANDAARELFTSTMATLVDMDLESHDRLIAYVLGLSHALNLAFVTARRAWGQLHRSRPAL